jgi:hypothetical protein
MTEHHKHVLDAAAAIGAVATIAGWLPAIAALFTIIWTGIRIIESETFERVHLWLKSKF